ncbi:hypothetical protein STRTUCAR8_08142, partial [Streptomyces turgidiscabies Car8]
AANVAWVLANDVEANLNNNNFTNNLNSNAA